MKIGGVPQASNLGNLLLLNPVNDMPAERVESWLNTFADDTLIMKEVKFITD